MTINLKHLKNSSINEHEYSSLKAYLVVLGPSRSSARLGFGSSFWEKKLGSARHAFQKARLGSARHILQKKLGSARLALSFKKLSYL